MTDMRVLEAWLHLMNDAMRGGGAAQQVIQALTGTMMSPDEQVRWMERVLPSGFGPLQADTVSTWLDEWYRMMGVVPKTRYITVLERCEDLRTKLEEAEKTIRQLQALLQVSGKEGEAQQMLDWWSANLRATLAAQESWMRMWMPTSGEQPAPEQPQATHGEPSPLKTRER